jgi:hypothetical protein
MYCLRLRLEVLLVLLPSSLGADAGDDEEVDDDDEPDAGDGAEGVGAPPEALASMRRRLATLVPPAASVPFSLSLSSLDFCAPVVVVAVAVAAAASLSLSDLVSIANAPVPLPPLLAESSPSAQVRRLRLDVLRILVELAAIILRPSLTREPPPPIPLPMPLLMPLPMPLPPPPRLGSEETEADNAESAPATLPPPLGAADDMMALPSFFCCCCDEDEGEGDGAGAGGCASDLVAAALGFRPPPAAEAAALFSLDSLLLSTR